MTSSFSPSASPAQPSRSASLIRAIRLSRMPSRRACWAGSARRRAADVPLTKPTERPSGLLPRSTDSDSATSSSPVRAYPSLCVTAGICCGYCASSSAARGGMNPRARHDGPERCGIGGGSGRRRAGDLDFLPGLAPGDVRAQVRGHTVGAAFERAVGPSSLSLHGLVRHLASVERWWFASSGPTATPAAEERGPHLGY